MIAPECKTRATVAKLLAARRLTAESVKRFSLRDVPGGGVEFPYPKLDGSVATSRIREFNETSHPTRWAKAGGPLLPFTTGQILFAARNAGQLAVVEGETDVLALAENGVPALGIPGHTMVKVLTKEYVDGIARIYATRESDAGGTSFITGLAEQLAAIEWCGGLFVVDLHAKFGVKDPSALHVLDPALFRERWALAQLAAEPFRRAAVPSANGVPSEEASQLAPLPHGAVVALRAEPTSTAGSGWVLESAADIAAEGLQPVEFDIETLLTKDDGPVLLFSPPGSLKSFLALHAARCAATGEDFLGKFAVRKRPCAIYVNFDAGARAFRRRAAMVAPNVKQLYVTSPDGYDAGALRDTIQKHPNAFVVIDCLSDCYQSQRGEDQAETMRRFMRELRGLYQKHGCNGIIVDHPRRAREGEAHGDYYGSVQKEAAARMMWQAQRLPSSVTNIVQVKLLCKKMSEAEPFEPFIAKVTFSAEHVDFAYDGRVDEVTGTRVEPTPDRVLLERVLAGVAGGMSRNALQLRLGWGADRVRAATKNSSGVVTIGSGKNIQYGLVSEQYDSLVAPDEPPDESKTPSPDSSVCVAPPKGALRKPTNQTDASERSDSSDSIDESAGKSETGDKSGDVADDWDA